MSRIVVGVDGSDSGGGAVDWALAAAKSGDSIVLANSWELHAVGGFESPYINYADFEAIATKLVTQLVDDVVKRAPDGVAVEGEVRHGHAGQMLIDLSADADMIVVGSRGHGGFKGLLLGSVSTYVVHHAQCPVVVVPEPSARA